MAHPHISHPAAAPGTSPTAGTGRGSNLAAWTLFALAAFLLALAVAGPTPEPLDRAGQAGPPMIEDWRGNSASITPAP